MSDQTPQYAVITKLVIEDRQRREFSPKALEELKRSILSKGLLHAIILTQEGDTFRLRAGERRCRACLELHNEGHTFKHNNIEVPNRHIPYTIASDLSPEDLFELELDENLQREDLTWMERTEAIAKLYEMRKAKNPNISKTEVAAELVERADGNTSISAERRRIAQSLIIMKHKDDPRVQRAKTHEEAFNAILSQHETKFQAEIALRTAATRDDNQHIIINADCREAFSQLPTNTISTIIADPPYGISADKQGKESNHFYDDSPDYALEINRFIIREGFKVTKPRALLFLWCDIEHFVMLRDYCAQQAWSPFRTPIIWNKGSGSRAPWGKAGFQRSYEILLFASKGGAELRISGGKDVLDCARSSRSDRTHAADKPFDLLQQLVSISTLPGDTILDPCAGSGSIIPAATSRSVKTICIEKDPTHYAEALARLTADQPAVEFDESTKIHQLLMG